jgi:endonuclease/exonuclease/phosphatase family metal-dependent hydrolase
VGKLGLFGKLVYILNVIFAFTLLLTCLAPFITWELFSFLSFLGLVVPFLVVANVVFLLYWLWRVKKYMLLSSSVLLLSYFVFDSFISFKSSEEEIKEKDLSIMSFNVRGFNKYNWIDNSALGDEVIEFVKKKNPKVVCFQEFSRIWNRQLTHYPYKYQTPYTSDKSIQAIHSIYPIIATGSLEFPESSNNAIYADILINEDTVRVYNIHLQSFRMRPGSIKREDPQRLFGRLDRSFQKQLEQAFIVRKHKDAVPYKSIICGDFNNTQFSNVYNTIKGDMNDTFQEKGFGLGSTYNFKFLPFRIDFILADPGIEVKSHTNFNVKLSDHTPVMASFCLQD